MEEAAGGAAAPRQAADSWRPPSRRGVLMTSLADHVHDPLCLCGKGEGRTALLGLH